MMISPSRRAALPALALLALASLAACAVGPDYARPKTITGDVFKEAREQDPDAAPSSPASAAIDWKVAEPGVVDISPWWAAFRDETLNALMPQLALANPDADTARANLRAARAAAREATAAFFPVISADGGASRGRSGGAASGGASGGAAVNNAYRAQLAASWELDLFGGIARGRESALAGAEAAEADLAATLLSLRGELVQKYFQLRAYDEQLDLYARTIAAYEKSLAITRNQHGAGVVTRLDVAQAQTRLDNARAAGVDIELQRRQTEHAIATLLGLPPSLLAIAPAPVTAHLPLIEPSLPAVLLERRPDIAAAERRMAAANAQIGVAKAAYFPSVTLSASGGYAGDAFRELFTLPNRIWSVGAALAQTVFQGGALLAKTDQAVANWEASVAAYRKTVLAAFRDVEDQLAAVALLEREEALQRDALRAARDAENLALSQYRAGVVTYLSVVSAQTAALSTAGNVATLKGRRFMAASALILSLGGGWAPAPYAQPSAAANGGDGT